MTNTDQIMYACASFERQQKTMSSFTFSDKLFEDE